MGSGWRPGLSMDVSSMCAISFLGKKDNNLGRSFGSRLQDVVVGPRDPVTVILELGDCGQ